jgi:hypothetical protein
MGDALDRLRGAPDDARALHDVVPLLSTLEARREFIAGGGLEILVTSLQLGGAVGAGAADVVRALSAAEEVAKVVAIARGVVEGLCAIAQTEEGCDVALRALWNLSAVTTNRKRIFELCSAEFLEAKQGEAKHRVAATWIIRNLSLVAEIRPAFANRRQVLLNVAALAMADDWRDVAAALKAFYALSLERPARAAIAREDALLRAAEAVLRRYALEFLQGGGTPALKIADEAALQLCYALKCISTSPPAAERTAPLRSVVAALAAAEDPPLAVGAASAAAMILAKRSEANGGSHRREALEEARLLVDGFASRLAAAAAREGGERDLTKLLNFFWNASDLTSIAPLVLAAPDVEAIVAAHLQRALDLRLSPISSFSYSLTNLLSKRRRTRPRALRRVQPLRRRFASPAPRGVTHHLRPARA